MKQSFTEAKRNEGPEQRKAIVPRPRKHPSPRACAGDANTKSRGKGSKLQWGTESDKLLNN